MKILRMVVIEDSEHPDDLNDIYKMWIRYDNGLIYRCVYYNVLVFSDGSYFYIGNKSIPDQAVPADLYSFCKEVIYKLISYQE